MAYERLIKRTIYEANCKCGDKTVVTDNPPKEKRCKCGEWVPFIENSVIGPDLEKK